MIYPIPISSVTIKVIPFLSERKYSIISRTTFLDRRRKLRNNSPDHFHLHLYRGNKVLFSAERFIFQYIYLGVSYTIALVRQGKWL